MSSWVLKISNFSVSYHLTLMNITNLIEIIFDLLNLKKITEVIIESSFTNWNKSHYTRWERQGFEDAY